MANPGTFVINPVNTFIEVAQDGLMEVEILYEIPGSKKESVTSLTYRVNVDRTATQGTPADDIYITRTGPNPADAIVHISAGYLGNVLYSLLVSPISEMQGEGVIYRKVNITAYKALTWERTVDASAIVDPNKPFIYEIAKTNSSLTVSNVYRQKCGFGVTGTMQSDDTTQREGLGFRCYLSGMSNISDKPSRFLVQGSVFASNKEAFESPSLEGVVSHLQEGFPIQTRAFQVRFTPVWLVAGYYRPCVVAQVEGLKKLAGSKARDLIGQIEAEKAPKPTQPSQPTGGAPIPTTVGIAVVKPQSKTVSRTLGVPTPNTPSQQGQTTGAAAPAGQAAGAAAPAGQATGAAAPAGQAPGPGAPAGQTAAPTIGDERLARVSTLLRVHSTLLSGDPDTNKAAARSRADATVLAAVLPGDQDLLQDALDDRLLLASPVADREALQDGFDARDLIGRSGDELAAVQRRIRRRRDSRTQNAAFGQEPVDSTGGDTRSP